MNKSIVLAIARDLGLTPAQVNAVLSEYLSLSFKLGKQELADNLELKRSTPIVHPKLGSFRTYAMLTPDTIGRDGEVVQGVEYFVLRFKNNKNFEKLNAENAGIDVPEVSETAEAAAE